MILNDVYPNSTFNLKLTNLKYLKLVKCYNISFTESNFLKLKYLHLIRDDLTYKGNELLKFPELTTLILDGIDKSNYDSIINLANLKKLKFFEGKSQHFMLLNNSKSIEKLTLYSFGQKELKKIISLETLQEIEITDILEMQLEYYRKNPSIKKLKIQCFEKRGNFNLFNFLENFPNLNDLSIKIHYKEPCYSCGVVSRTEKFD